MDKLFEAVAKKFPDRIAISDDEGKATFGALLARSTALHEQLLTPGTIVLVAVPGGVAFTTVQLACFAAKAVFVPIPHQSTLREASTFAEIASPDVVVVASVTEQAPVIQACDEQTIIVTLEKAPSLVEGRTVVTFDDLVARKKSVRREAKSPFPPETRTIQFTSGSTGRPKGILLSNDSWKGTLDQNREHLTRFSETAVFCPLPQFHAMGCAVVVEHLFHGSPIHLANEFNPGTHVARLVEHRCVAILASPNYFKLMSRLGVISKESLPALTSVTIGTAAIDEVLIDDLRRLFPELHIHCRYGLSESVGAMARLTLKPGIAFQKGLIGPPVPGVELLAGLPKAGAAEPGELKVKSAANAIGIVTTKGTWSPLLDDAGYLATGDLAFLTDDGQLLVRGRLSTFLKSNGYRINPFEIEDVLRAIPNVQEAVVVGVPDPAAGQRIIACLEASPNMEAPTTADVLKTCEAALSPYKVPQGVLVLAPMPRTPAGKPDRAKILEAATAWVAEAAAAAAAAGAAAGAGNQERVMAIVSRVITENVGHAVKLTPDENLVKGGYLDSLTMVSLVVALQEEFGVAIPAVNLTPEQFASVDVIVDYLFPSDGSVFRAPDAPADIPARAPNLSFVLALALALVLIVTFAHAPSDANGLTARALVQAKARCVACADLVITGSSQAGSNFVPSVLHEALPDMKIMNMGYSTQPYSDVYLDMIARTLTSSPRRTILMVVTPISLVPRAGDDEAAYSLTLVDPESASHKLFGDFREHFHTRLPCEFLLSLCDKHRYVWRYEDGWTAEVVTGAPSETAGLEPTSRFMRRWGAILHYDPASTIRVTNKVRAWRAAGIHVYTVRAPVPPKMLEAELAMPNYDESAMLESFRAAGAEWVPVDASRYVYFDGWHMERDDAKRFSEDIGKTVAGMLARESDGER